MWGWESRSLEKTDCLDYEKRAKTIIYLRIQSLEGNMQHYFAFSFCVSSRMLELGIRIHTEVQGRALASISFGQKLSSPWRVCWKGKGGGGERKQEGVSGRRREVPQWAAAALSPAATFPPCGATTLRHGLYYRPHFAD